MSTQTIGAAESARVLAGMPHEAPMLLIDHVMEIGASHIVCRAVITDEHILLREGRVPNVLVIELFAQTACAYEVSRALGCDGAPVSGMLLGTRKIELDTEFFVPGDVLTIRAEELWGSGPLAQFACSISQEGRQIGSGSINVARGLPDGPPS